MSLKKTCFILSLFIFISANSQNINTNPFWEAELELADGTVKNGYVQVPNVSRLKNVVFKKTPKGKKEKIKRKAVKSLKVTSENGIEYLYELVPTVITLKGNTANGKSLLLVEGKNDYVTFYIESGAYKVDKKTGELYLIYRYHQGKDFPVISRFIKKRGAQKANMFYMTGYVGGFKRSAKHHLTEDKALLQKIQNKTLGKKDIPEIISIYLETTEGM